MSARKQRRLTAFFQQKTPIVSDETPSTSQSTGTLSLSSEAGENTTGSNIGNEKSTTSAFFQQKTPIVSDETPSTSQSTGTLSPEAGENTTGSNIGNEKSTTSVTSEKVSRTFCDKWLTTNFWLRYEHGKMFCDVCQSEGKGNPFTEGCTNFRNSTLQRHISSIQHKAALEARSLRDNMQKQTEMIFSKKNEAALGALRSVYWLAKEQLPTLKHKSLLMLQKLQGCSFPDELNVGDNATYTSHTAAEEMQNAIASVLSDDVNSKLSESPYIAILMDESCDISVTEKLLIYARTVNSDYELTTHFISNIQIPNGTAKTIYDSVKNVLAERNVAMDRVLVVGSDGASVMTGSKNGVVALIRQKDSPFVLGIHCIAHRLALCSSQAADKVPYLKQYQRVLSDIFYHFKRSALRREKMKAIQTVLHDPHIQYKELHSVRWFSMYSALEAVYRTWSSLATYMETEMENSNDSTAKGFFKKITSYSFIATTHLLMDVIPKITQLSLFFQKEDIDLAMLRPSVDSVVQQLVWLKTNDGHFLAEFLAIAGEKITEFKGVKVVDTPILRQQFGKVRQTFISNLVQEIERRFPAVATDVVSNMSVLSMRGLLLLPSDDRETFGESQLQTLVQHYGQNTDGATALIDPEQTLIEWKKCKDVVVQQKYPCHTVHSTWKLLAGTHPGAFPNLVKLSMVAVLAPLQTATVERGFSIQNDIKVSSRNRLSSDRLNTLMQISMGPDIEQFDFQSALSKWKKIKQRRLFSK